MMTHKGFALLLIMLTLGGCGCGRGAETEYATDAAGCWYKQQGMAWTQYPCGHRP